VYSTVNRLPPLESHLEPLPAKVEAEQENSLHGGLYVKCNQAMWLERVGMLVGPTVSAPNKLS
jgi:hypothetical protein